MNHSDFTTELFRVASPLFLFLVSFRRKLRKGYQVDEAMVRQDLDEIFARIEREVRRDPRLEALYEKAKYPLVVLADEVLLHSDWEYASSWAQQYLLEERHFQTNIGGDKIFQIAEELRYDEVELATMLYTAICLGVKGGYHHQPEKLEEVKNKLYRQAGEYLAEVRDKLTPDAYHVDAKEAVKLSPAVTLARVLIVGAGLVLLYWLATRLSWGVVVSDLRAIVAGLV